MHHQRLSQKLKNVPGIDALIIPKVMTDDKFNFFKLSEIRSKTANSTPFQMRPNASVFKIFEFPYNVKKTACTSGGGLVK